MFPIWTALNTRIFEIKTQKTDYFIFHGAAAVTFSINICFCKVMTVTLNFSSESRFRTQR